MNAKAQVNHSQHPLYNPHGFILETLETQQLEEVLHRWMWNGATGGLVFGEARIGKTQALQQLKNSLCTRCGDPIPSIYFSVAQRDTTTIASIYRLLCNSINLSHSRRDRTDYLSDAVVHYLADLADASGSKTLVIYIDEMQRLHVKQLNIFAELYDRLKLLNIHLMCVFVGNDPECLDLVKLTQRSAYAHVRGRFLTQFHRFEGLLSASGVRRCLEQYDTARYPKDGQTFVEYFLPEAVANGFTLSSTSSILWGCFCEYAKPLGIRSWGMQYFTSTINCLLLDFLPRHGIENFGQEMVNAALNLSGIDASRVRSIS
ncbi:MAG: ATP-binding protein [Pseudomonadota bacterium]|nr:ATP-binding protein [Pseudomonadota bacterium]